VTSSLRPRVFLYDAALRRVGQIASASRVNRSYTMDEPGILQFGMALDDAMVQEVSPLLGRIVVVESDFYPVPWVGRITTAQRARASGTIVVNASSFEAIFEHRFVDGLLTVDGSPARAVRGLLGHINTVNPTGVRAGNIAERAVRATSTLAYARARDALDGLADLAGFEWWVEAGVGAKSIDLRLHFQAWRGFDRLNSVALVDGGSCSWIDWSVDGEAYTFGLTVLGGSASSGQSLRSRPAKRVVPRTNDYIGPHGYLRFGPGDAANLLQRNDRMALAQALRVQGQVTAAAEVMMQQQRIAGVPMSVRLTAAMDEDVWAGLELGNIVTLKLPDAFFNGFDGPARIRGVQPMEEDGDAEIVVELLRGPP